MASDVLTNFKMQVLQEHMTTLSQSIEAKEFLPYMRSAGVFSMEDDNIIKGECVKHYRANKFIEMTIEKCPAAYDAFIEALYDKTKHVNLLTKLSRSLEQYRLRYEDENKIEEEKPCVHSQFPNSVQPYPPPVQPYPPPLQPPPPPAEIPAFVEGFDCDCDCE